MVDGEVVVVWWFCLVSEEEERKDRGNSGGNGEGAVEAWAASRRKSSMVLIAENVSTVLEDGSRTGRLVGLGKGAKGRHLSVLFVTRQYKTVVIPQNKVMPATE